MWLKEPLCTKKVIQQLKSPQGAAAYTVFANRTHQEEWHLVCIKAKLSSYTVHEPVGNYTRVPTDDKTFKPLC